MKTEVKMQELIEVIKKININLAGMMVLTGAGVSAASGIPTFRGKDGYWRKGSENYHPESIGRFDQFLKDPFLVWEYLLHRKSICDAAYPNQAHEALVLLQKRWLGNFQLVTQNVDGLHLRAGNSQESTIEAHGNIYSYRCPAECSQAIYPIPNKRQWQDIKCHRCGLPGRPHILFFDEVYNERHYKFDTIRHRLEEAGMLIMAGTSGAVALPNELFDRAMRKNIPIINIDTTENIFFEELEHASNGYNLLGGADKILIELVRALQIKTM